MSKLPQGWVLTDIGSLGEYINGATFKPKDWSTKGKPIVRIQNLTNPSKDIHYYSGELDPKYHISNGDILVSWSATLDVFLWERGDAWLNQHIFKVVPSQEIDKRFLFYALKEAIAELKSSEHLHGSTMKHINRKPFLAHKILLPPKNEQERIAEKLNRIFRELDSIKTRLDKIHIILKNFRQSVYDSAVTGYLSKSWRDKKNVLGADDLREMIYNEYSKEKNCKVLFTEKDTALDAQLPESWVAINLEKVCLKFTYGSSQKSQKKGNVPVLRMGNIQGGTIDWEKLVYSSDKKEIEKYKLNIGDVLFNRTNSPELVGKTAIYRGEHEAIYAGYLIKISPSTLLIPEYLNMCLNSSLAKDYCWKVKSDGVSQSNINAKKLGKMPIPFCSIQEQELIVEQALQLFSIADQIEEKYDLAKQKINAISQSVLNKAFQGRLLPQNLDDEHASILLKKIKEEKQYQTSIPTKETRTAKKSKEVRKMILSVLDTLKQEQKPLTAQSLLEKSGYPRDADSETIEKFFLDIRKCLIEGTIVRERVQDEDVFKLVA